MTEREAFEAYWNESQFRSWQASGNTNGLIFPPEWGLAFKPHAWQAWQARACHALSDFVKEQP